MKTNNSISAWPIIVSHNEISKATDRASMSPTLSSLRLRVVSASMGEESLVAAAEVVYRVLLANRRFEETLRGHELQNLQVACIIGMFRTCSDKKRQVWQMLQT